MTLSVGDNIEEELKMHGLILSWGYIENIKMDKILDSHWSSVWYWYLAGKELSELFWFGG